MLKELKILYDVTKQNDFKEIVKRWKERFLKFYAVIDCDDRFKWERAYKTCILLEAMYGSELAKSYLFDDDTEKIREESAVGVLLSEALEYYVVLKKLNKDDLLAELDRCLEKMFNKSLEKIKKEGNND